MVKKIDPDATYATALWRGGRLTKWKGQAASLSPSLGQLIASVSVFALGRALTVGASKTATAALLGGVGLILTTSGVSAACDESPLGSGVHSCSGEINGTVALISAGDQLTITSSATITGDTDGINARNYGTGALSITTSGAITGGTGYGIKAKTTAGKTVNITLNSGSAVSSATGLGIFNDGGNSTTTVKAGASVAGKIVLGAGDDNLVLAGGDLSAVCNLDRPRRPRKTNR